MLDPAFVKNGSAFWCAALEYSFGSFWVDRDHLCIDLSLPQHPRKTLNFLAAHTADTITVLQAVQQRGGSTGAARGLEAAACHPFHGFAYSEMIHDLSPIDWVFNRWPSAFHAQGFFPKTQPFGPMFIEFRRVVKAGVLIGVLRCKALIVKGLSVFYAASQALMPKRCNVLLESVTEIAPPLEMR
ncbi:hypothetical protein [Pseudomonas fragi]|uniref:hypothetical protein n=1 Tax=Pseudomonas fragi TaxID=296 RepID=UPI0011401B03|nr:hypothetical protein [Pseudomonas fragi]